MNKFILFFVVIIAIALGGTYLSQQTQSDYVPTELRIGVLPDQDLEALNVQFAPLLNYLSRTLDIKAKLVPAVNYQELTTRLANKEVDLAYFGGVTFLKAQHQSGARPLIMRDVDSRFTSVYVVPASSTAQGIRDLKGKVLSYGSELSTSGHLMPRYFFELAHTQAPESFFSEVKYSGAHDKTVLMVASGDADVGAVNSEIYRRMLKDGRVTNEQVKLLWESPPYVDYVWAVRADMASQFTQKIRNAFLELDFNNPEHQAILNNMGAKLFLPASDADFAQLKNIMQARNMLK